MSPTGSRGSSDASGSWKTTWTSRRSCLRSPRSSAPTSVPSTATVPCSGGSISRICMIVVVLPQPDSPTRPSASPSRTSKLMPSTAVIGADPAAQHDALGDRVALREVAHLEHRRRAARGAPPRGRWRSPAAGRPAPRGSARARSPRCGWQAARRPPPPVGSRAGSIVSQTEMLTGQRGDERTALRQPGDVRRGALDRRERLAAAGPAAAPSPAARSCTASAGRRRPVVDRPALDRPCPRT